MKINWRKRCLTLLDTLIRTQDELDQTEQFLQNTSRLLTDQHVETMQLRRSYSEMREFLSDLQKGLEKGYLVSHDDAYKMWVSTLLDKYPEIEKP